MKIFLLPLLCFSLNDAFSQQDKYPYTYHLKLADQPSYCFYKADHVLPGQQDTVSEITIKLINDDESPAFGGSIRVVVSDHDTLSIITDAEGVVKRKLPNGFRLIIDWPGYSLLNTYIAPRYTEKIADVTVILGRSYRLDRSFLKCKRPLTQKEIIDIIQKLSKNPDEMNNRRNADYILMSEI